MLPVSFGVIGTEGPAKGNTFTTLAEALEYGKAVKRDHPSSVQNVCVITPIIAIDVE